MNVPWLQDILNKIGANGDAAAMNTTLFAGQQDIHDHVTAIPTSGAVVSTASCTAAGTIVEDGTSGTPNTVNVSVAETTNNTFGSWTELDASVAEDSFINLISIAFISGCDVTANWILEIGTGSAGNEVTKIRWSFGRRFMDASGLEGPIKRPISPPIKVTSGTRISARLSKSVNASGTPVTAVSISRVKSLET